jgi:hypothetical protein
LDFVLVDWWGKSSERPLDPGKLAVVEAPIWGEGELLHGDYCVIRSV